MLSENLRNRSLFVQKFVGQRTERGKRLCLLYASPQKRGGGQQRPREMEATSCPLDCGRFEKVDNRRGVALCPAVHVFDFLFRSVFRRARRHTKVLDAASEIWRRGLDRAIMSNNLLWIGVNA